VYNLASGCAAAAMFLVVVFAIALVVGAGFAAGAQIAGW
jgi:hypothetical protein